MKEKVTNKITIDNIFKYDAGVIYVNAFYRRKLLSSWVFYCLGSIIYMGELMLKIRNNEYKGDNVDLIYWQNKLNMKLKNHEIISKPFTIVCPVCKVRQTGFIRVLDYCRDNQGWACIGKNCPGFLNHDELEEIVQVSVGDVLILKG